MCDNEERPAWYPVRVTYSREQKLKAYFDSVGVESFLPMHYVAGKGIRAGRKCLVPLIHNLLFVRSTRTVLDEFKNANLIASTMRYIMDKATHKPLVVPDEQMRNFIAVSGTNDEQLVYLRDEEISFRIGDRVRVTAGPFAGVEGELLRIRGDRRVVVRLDGLFAVATTFINPALLEQIS